MKLIQKLTAFMSTTLILLVGSAGLSAPPALADGSRIGMVKAYDAADVTVSSAAATHTFNNQSINLAKNTVGLISFRFRPTGVTSDTPYLAAWLNIYVVKAGTVCPFRATSTFDETTLTWAQTTGSNPVTQKSNAAGPCQQLAHGWRKIDVSADAVNYLHSDGNVFTYWLEGDATIIQSKENNTGALPYAAYILNEL